MRPRWLAVLTALSLPLLAACGGGEATASVDLSGVDACALLDEATVQELTGEDVGFSTQDLSMPSSPQCFWGANVAGVGGYVEVTLGKRPNLDGYTFQGGQCPEQAVDGVGDEARGGTCPADPQAKVYLLVADRGVMLTVLVNDPSRPLAPGDLADTAASVLAQLS